MHYRSALLLLLLFLPGLAGAQSSDVKFGAITVEEMEPATFGEQQEVDAMYIYRYRKTFYTYEEETGLRQFTDVHERIKIFTKNGLDYANKTISLYKSGTSQESVSGIKGWTFNVVDGKVAYSKLNKTGIFKTKVSSNFNQVKIALPEAREGSVVEFKYRIKSPYIGSIDEYELQAEVPIKRLESSLVLPEWFKFNQRQRGRVNITPKEEITHDSRFNAKVSTLYFNGDNIDALPEEPYVRNPDNFLGAVQVEINSVQLPGGPQRSYSKSWSDVARNVHNRQDFLNGLTDDGFFQSDLKAALEGATEMADKITRIYALTQEKVRWNGKARLYPSGTREAYKAGSGNSADVNLTLIAMLRSAGIPAYPILMSTVSHGIPYFPTIQGFNYVIVGIPNGNNYFMMDATATFAEPGLLPSRALNGVGRVVLDGEGNTAQVRLAASKRAFDMVTLTGELSEDGYFEGSVNQEYTQQNALRFRNRYHSSSPEEFVEELKEGTTGLDITNHKVTDLNTIGKPVSHSYDMVLEDVGEEIGGKIYFSPMMHFALTENPFLKEERKFPVDFAYPWMDKHTVEIALPEGYEVESLPEGLELMLPQNMGTYKLTITAGGTKVSLSSRLSFRTAIIAPNHYSALKDFYSQLVQKQTEKVVLKKMTGE